MALNVVPPDGQDATRDLGTDLKRWRDVKLSRNLSDGTNTVSVANILSKTGGTMTGNLIIGEGVKICFGDTTNYMIFQDGSWLFFKDDVQVGQMP